MGTPGGLMIGHQLRMRHRAGSPEVSGRRSATARARVSWGWRGGAVAVCASLLLTFWMGPTFAQTSGEIRYLYDDGNRLIAVIDAAGNVARFEYDAVGNLLAISRYASSTVSIIDFTARSGEVGTQLTVSRNGFSATAPQNTVTFNGTPAIVTSATVTEIVTAVPSGATSGPITVTAPGGSASSNGPFTVTVPDLVP